MLKLSKTVLFILAMSVIDYYLPVILFIEKIPVSQYWRVIIFRVLAIFISWLLVRALFPQALLRWRAPRFQRNLVGPLLFIAFFFIYPAATSLPSDAGISSIAMLALFTLGIGIDEEGFSRGLIFASLEKYGVRTAAIFSSLHFGLSHVTNILSNQSFAYTLSQMISAAAFGYLMCALMLVTESIWVGAIAHAFCDFPMQWSTKSEVASLAHASFDWQGTLLYCIFYISAAETLLFMSNPSSDRKLARWGEKFGLVRT